MRLATYNVEWFTHLFDDAGNLLDDDRWSGRHDVTRHQQIEALGIVFTALDADGVMIIEAPDSHRRRDGIAALEEDRRPGAVDDLAGAGPVVETLAHGLEGEGMA